MKKMKKIRLLEAGANDHLSKPFGIRELIVRVKVLLRDLINTHLPTDILETKDIKLEISTNQVWFPRCAPGVNQEGICFFAHAHDNARQTGDARRFIGQHLGGDSYPRFALLADFSQSAAKKNSTIMPMISVLSKRKLA